MKVSKVFVLAVSGIRPQCNENFPWKKNLACWTNMEFPLFWYTVRVTLSIYVRVIFKAMLWTEQSLLLYFKFINTHYHLMPLFADLRVRSDISKVVSILPWWNNWFTFFREVYCKHMTLLPTMCKLPGKLTPKVPPWYNSPRDLAILPGRK